MPTHIQTLSLAFDLPLEAEEIPAFRSAVLHAAAHCKQLTPEGMTLFHNHDPGNPENVIRRYPLINYRCHDGLATLVGMNEGAEALRVLRASGALGRFKMGGHNMKLSVVRSSETDNFTPKVYANRAFHYRLYKYIPFSSKPKSDGGLSNYAEYKKALRFSDKLVILERTLNNQLLSAADGLGWRLPAGKRLEAWVADVDRMTKVKAPASGQKGKTVDLLAMDLVISTNVHLPDRISLGRHTTYGFGWLFRLP